MKKNKKSFVFFGNERLATGVKTSTPILSRLLLEGYDPCFIVVNSNTVTSRKSRENEVELLAKENKITVIQIQNNNELIEHIKSSEAAFAVLSAYGRMVPQKIIDLFEFGIINIHPSLLPMHRGSIPIESVILNGESKSGVSIMQLVKEMDAGPVFAQASVALEGRESKQELTDKLANLGSELLIDSLPLILSGELTPKPQNDGDATYDNRISKEDGVINWDKPAIQIEREIRAYQYWPKSTAEIGNVECVITKARVLEKSGEAGKILIEDKKLAVYCSEGALLIESLKPIGKNDMTTESFLAGYSSRL